MALLAFVLGPLHLVTPLDPLHGDGYQFWSGIGFSTAVVVWWRKHNCHVHRCPFIAWHPHPDHGHEVCRWHHPHHKRVKADGITTG